MASPFIQDCLKDNKKGLFQEIEEVYTEAKGKQAEFYLILENAGVDISRFAEGNFHLRINSFIEWITLSEEICRG